MKLDHRSLHVLRSVHLMALLALTSGCAVMNRGESASLELPGKAEAIAGQPTATAGQPTASITIEVRADGKKPEIGQIPLNGSPRIQEVLEQSGLVKKFRRMDIVVMRAIGDQRQKLESKYDHSEGFVSPLYDYQLHPGDHLVVTEDTSTVFDDMLNSLAQRGKKG